MMCTGACKGTGNVRWLGGLNDEEAGPCADCGGSGLGPKATEIVSSTIRRFLDANPERSPDARMLARAILAELRPHLPLEEEWKSFDDPRNPPPHDRPILIYYETLKPMDLAPFLCVVKWHNEGGFCADELRIESMWKEAEFPCHSDFYRLFGDDRGPR